MPEFIPLQFTLLPEQEQLRRARAFYEQCAMRRTVRQFSTRPVSRELLTTLLRTAGTAPSGANRQPWQFVVVTDQDTKHRIRIAAEKEEKESYEERMPEQWLKDLEVLGTDWHKEFLEQAPALIVVFAVNYDLEEGKVHKNYYVKESVGIAVGFFLAAVHHAGLVSLTHTPSPMNFLQKILHRPENERPYMLIPVGYPAEGAVVPAIGRKRAEEYIQWHHEP